MHSSWNNQISHCNDDNNNTLDLSLPQTNEEKYLSKRLMSAEATITRYTLYGILFFVALVFIFVVTLYGEINHVGI